MKTETVTKSAESYWRENEDDAKNECNRHLQIKVEDEISRRKEDGWDLVSASFTDYIVEHDAKKDLFLCSRSKILVFEM